MMRFFSLIFSFLVVFAAQSVAQSSNPYGTAIRVNDGVITNYELDQRIRMLQAFGTTGDLRKLASDQLIDDRLRQQAAKALNVTADQEEVEGGLDAFAARGNLSKEQLFQYLAQRGVDGSTLRSFVEINFLWRNVVRAKFGRKATITDNDVDTALSLSAQGTAQSVLFAEIIIPGNERGAEATEELTNRLSNTIKTEGAFGAAARRYSRSPSARNGGRLPWTPIANLPPRLVGQLLALEEGEVTAPIPLGQAIGLFQLRDVRTERDSGENTVTATYVEAPIPVSGTVENQRRDAQQLIDDIDTCADLRAQVERFGENGSFSDGVGQVSDLPSDLAFELAKLDPNEASAELTRGNQIVVVMLCTRSKDLAEGARDEIRNALFQQRMGSFGNGYLQELKGDAIIVFK